MHVVYLRLLLTQTRILPRQVNKDRTEADHNEKSLGCLAGCILDQRRPLEVHVCDGRLNHAGCTVADRGFVEE